MSLDTVTAPSGSEATSAPASGTAVHTAGGEGPLSIRDAARSVTDWRRKAAAGETTQMNSGQVEAAQLAEPPDPRINPRINPRIKSGDGDGDAQGSAQQAGRLQRRICRHPHHG